MRKRYLAALLLCVLLSVGCGALDHATDTTTTQPTSSAGSDPADVAATLVTRPETSTPPILAPESTPEEADPEPVTPDTSIPAATQVPAQGSYGMAYVADVTIPDGTHFPPGAPFTKTWSLKNTGTLPWDDACGLLYTGGDQMGALPSVDVPNAAAGEVVEVSVAMVAPTQPGEHKATWQLCRAGDCYGTATVVIVTEGDVSADSDATLIVAEAWVSNETPGQNSTVTAYGRITQGGVGLPGVLMSVSWHYKTTTPTCEAISGDDGIADCSRDIGRATVGNYVEVVIRFDYQGDIYKATTGFTPR